MLRQFIQAFFCTMTKANFENCQKNKQIFQVFYFNCFKRKLLKKLKLNDFNIIIKKKTCTFVRGKFPKKTFNN